MPAAPVFAPDGSRTITCVFIDDRNNTKDRPRGNTIILQSSNLDKVTGHRRGNVERGGSDKDFHEPLPLPDQVSSRCEPMTDDNR